MLDGFLYEVDNDSLADPESGGFIGLGLSLNPETGDFDPKGIAFLHTATQAPVPLRQDLEISIGSRTYRSSALEEQSFSISASFGALAAAGTIDKSTSTSSSAVDDALKVAISQVFDPEMIVLADVVAPNWTNGALQVLAVGDPVERRRRWKEEFGEYVVVGTNFARELGFEFSFTSQTSSEERAFATSMRARYSSLAGSASAAFAATKAVEESLAAEEYVASFYWILGQDPGIAPPDYSSLDTPEERAMLINKMLAAFDLPAATTGAVVLPWQLIEGTPLHGDILEEAPLVGEAARLARLSMDYLVSAQQWNSPLERRSFLQSVLDQSGVDYLEILDAERNELIDLCAAMWIAVGEFVADPRDGTEAAALAAYEAVSGELVLPFPEGLPAVLERLGGLRYTLPEIEILPVHSQTRAGGTVTGHFLVNNVAYFGPLSAIDIARFLRFSLPVGGFESFKIWEDQRDCNSYPENNNLAQNIPCTFRAGCLTNLQILSWGPSVASGAEGLYDLEFRVNFNTVPGACDYRLRVLDHLGRLGKAGWSSPLN